MVFSRIILGFIISKEGKTLAPKKIEAICRTPDLFKRLKCEFKMKTAEE